MGRRRGRLDPQSEKNLVDFRKRLTTLGTAMTVADRNFYPGDGTWELDVRGALRTSLDEGDAPV